MRLFVLGATGRIGGEILDIALARGHEVTAFVRSPDKLTRRDGLRIVPGDPRSTDGLAAAMPDHDAVLSALGPPGREGLRPSTLQTDTAASIVAAMATSGVTRLGIVSAALLFKQEGGLRYAFFRWLTRHHLRDLETMEAIVSASELAWTIARPPRLIVGPQETYRAARDGLPPRGTFSTSFRSVGAFLVDAVEQRKHLGEIVGVTH